MIDDARRHRPSPLSLYLHYTRMRCLSVGTLFSLVDGQFCGQSFAASFPYPVNKMRICSFIIVFSSLWVGGDAFLPRPGFSYSATLTESPSKFYTSLLAAPKQKLTSAQQFRRKELLDRSGPYFKFDRFQGSVEFGSTAKLVTKLDNEFNPNGIAEWLSDGRGLALSIWDESMMKDLGNSIYRLQTMKLQFVTIKLAPSVDVQMWSQTDPNTGEPVFSLQSVDFDPNIQLLPGVGVSTSSLGLQIDVAGELRPSKDGKGVTGSISFATTGKLPPPMRMLPESPLRMASNSINDKVVTFAVNSFQKGAIRKYKEFSATEKTESANPQEQEV